MRIDRIELERVSVFFGATPGLRALNATLEPGLTLVTGPNGSGKSTVLGLLSGRTPFQRGALRFHAGARSVARPRSTVLAHACGLYPDLTARENLSLFATYWNASPQQVPVVIERFGLQDFCERVVRGYSQGQRQRTAIARAALCPAPLVLLDEPETGLDESAQETLAGFVDERRKDGSFVLWVTHHAAHALAPDAELRMRDGTQEVVP